MGWSRTAMSIFSKGKLIGSQLVLFFLQIIKRLGSTLYLKDFQEDNKAEEMMRKINELEVRLGKIDSLEESVQKLQDSQDEGFNLLNKTLKDLGEIGSPDDDYRESPMIAGLRSSMGTPDGMNGSNRI